MAWMRDPDDGEIGQVEDSNVDQALQSGLVQIVRMRDPDDGEENWVEYGNHTKALEAGLEIVATPDIKKDQPLFSQPESAARGGLQGLTLGFGDELVSGAKTAGEFIGRGLSGIDQSQRQDVSNRYSQILDEYRQLDEQAKQQFPKTYGGSELAGSVATSSILPTPSIGTIAKLPAFPTKNADELAQMLGIMNTKNTSPAVVENLIKNYPNLISKQNLQNILASGTKGAAAGAIGAGLSEYGHQEQTNLGDIGEAVATGAAVGGAIGGGSPVVRDAGAAIANTGISALKAGGKLLKDVSPTSIGLADVMTTGQPVGTLAKMASQKYGDKIQQIKPSLTQTQKMISKPSASMIEPTMGKIGGTNFSSLLNYINPKDEEKEKEDFANNQSNTYE